MDEKNLLQIFNSVTDEKKLSDQFLGVKEDLHVEFKLKKDRRIGKLDDSDKWQFSRALSGFANSAGGLLLWGIETNKKEEACKLKPISEVHLFLNSLKKSLINTTQPIVEGVILDVITQKGSKENGYVKCFIPQSEKTPHRAMLAEREYYKRSIEGFYKLEHFDLEDMFGRRQRPFLVPEIEVEIIKKTESNDEYKIKYVLKNEGRNIARYTGFMCSFTENIEITGAHTVKNLSKLNDGKPVLTYENLVGVIHPTNMRTHVGDATFVKKDKGQVQMAMQVYCENMLARTYYFFIDGIKVSAPKIVTQ